MGFSDLLWDEDCQLFPDHHTVLEYLEQYATDIRHLIKFQTRVVDVSPLGTTQWTVRSKPMTTSDDSTCAEEVFDAVLVASGHFEVPYVPSVSGIEAWNEAYPGRILHSKSYRRPEDFEDKKVVVVGNSASGVSGDMELYIAIYTNVLLQVDIASQISKFCASPLLQSTKDSAESGQDHGSSIVQKPEIEAYVVDNSTVRFEDGTTESGVDAVLYCTGYFYSYPFLLSLNPPVITTGERVENLFQHIFYQSRPTLAFAALNQKIIPFPVAEAQSAVIARVWSGRLELPSERDMELWENQTLEESGGRSIWSKGLILADRAIGGRNFHVLKFPKDADYINMLHGWG